MRFLDDYDPRKEQKKKQQKNGALSAPRSGNSLFPFAQNSKNKTNTPSATPRTTKGTALGGSSVTPVQLPVQQITVPKLTKSATPMQTQTPQALTLKLPNIQAFGAGDYSKAGKAMDRIAKTVQAGAAQTASGFAEIAGQFRPTTGQQSMGQFSGFGDLGRAVRENREKGTDINTSILLQERQRRVQQKQSQQKIFDAAIRLTERGQQYTQEAKQGLGTVGQFLVDMGVTGTQMAGDALANLILPGSGLVMMGMRSYGQAAGEARREGKSEGQQFLAGLKSAGIEVFTEKMFGASSKIYGGAAADELVQKLVGKLTENATGQALLTWIVNAVGEGVEEVTSDLLNPLADRLLRLDDGKGPVWSTDDLAQWGYDFLLGTAMGMETDAEKMRLIDSSDLTEQQKASLYKNLVAGKEDLKKIYALLDADISDYQYFQYKLTTSGLTKKEAKLNAINTLDLPDSQKDALYYLNSYASSTHGEAPWVQGMTAEQSTVRLAEILAEEEDDEDNTPKWQQSLNSYLGKGNTNSEVSQMLANVRRLNGGTAGGYSSGGGLTVSAMLANVRRLNGRTVGGYSSGSNLTVSEMLANVRRLNR